MRAWYICVVGASVQLIVVYSFIVKFEEALGDR